VARRCCPACRSIAVLPHACSDAPPAADKKNSQQDSHSFLLRFLHQFSTCGAHFVLVRRQIGQPSKSNNQVEQHLTHNHKKKVKTRQTFARTIPRHTLPEETRPEQHCPIQGPRPPFLGCKQHECNLSEQSSEGDLRGKHSNSFRLFQIGQKQPLLQGKQHTNKENIEFRSIFFLRLVKLNWKRAAAK
jgi:hypothetical protein